MPSDPRFYLHKIAPTLGQLADLCEGRLIRGDRGDRLSGIAAADQAETAQLCFLQGGPGSLASLSHKATHCIVTEQLAEHMPSHIRGLIIHDRPRWAHSLISLAMYEKKSWVTAGSPPVTDPTAHIHPTASLSSDVQIGANCHIGPHVYIGPGVSIGRGSTISAGCTLECCLIGEDVCLLPGAHIGQAGFGVTDGPDGAEDIPHWGRVIIGDKVSIGAGTCIDRGVFDDTLIGAHTKIDNHCQIAHNVEIGRNVRMASFTGISGSTRIGDGTFMGGSVGVTDHITIGRNVQLLAGAGVMRDIPDGERWGGRPAKPYRDFFREIAWLQKQAAPHKKTS